MQGVEDKDASLFQEMANKGHYANRGGTRQGIYVCTPKGELLSSINSLNPDHVFENILIGLDKWNKLSQKSKILLITLILYLIIAGKIVILNQEQF